MSTPQRCLVVVPADAVDLYAKLVTAFVDNPRVFVLRDRRIDARALRSPEVFAVGGGELDPALRATVEEALRRAGARS
jgi:hypothetical protein